MLWALGLWHHVVWYQEFGGTNCHQLGGFFQDNAYVWGTTVIGSAQTSGSSPKTRRPVDCRGYFLLRIANCTHRKPLGSIRKFCAANHVSDCSPSASGPGRGPWVLLKRPSSLNNFAKGVLGFKSVFLVVACYKCWESALGTHPLSCATALQYNICREVLPASIWSDSESMRGAISLLLHTS